MTVANGNNYSVDSTSKTFSIYTQNGYCNWSKYNNTYTVASSSYSVGYMGTRFGVLYAWDVGGGVLDQYYYTTSLGIGSLPS